MMTITRWAVGTLSFPVGIAVATSLCRLGQLMDEKLGSRTLTIDGETVVFQIDVANNVASGRIPSPRAFLGYRVVRAGKVLREGVLKNDVQHPSRVADHFSDDELESLYRSALERD